jgi:hypothetical protein
MVQPGQEPPKPGEPQALKEDGDRGRVEDLVLKSQSDAFGRGHTQRRVVPEGSGSTVRGLRLRTSSVTVRACRGCSFKPRCTRAKRCTINRPAHTATRAFADLKGNHALGRATLRGPAFEVQTLLAATAHNIKQLVKGRPVNLPRLAAAGG